MLVLLSLLIGNSVYLVGIRCLEWQGSSPGGPYGLQNRFYLWMFLAHLVCGVVGIAPFCYFGVRHILAARRHRNRRAVRLGYLFFAVSLLVIVTGVMLLRPPVFGVRHAVLRSAVFWLHVVAPAAAGVLFLLHRLAGPQIDWKRGGRFGGGAVACAVLLGLLHGEEQRPPAASEITGSVQDFSPSLARVSAGTRLTADELMMDQYCMKCHQDAYDGWFHSAHHFSSFNNPMYLASIRETRKVVLERDGDVLAARWCAGCHDPVPLLTGAFDSPEYDDVGDPTAHAGITCTTCHMISEAHSTRGNAAFMIERAVHYPFTGSRQWFLQFVNEQLIKAKPEFHSRTFLKPVHKSEEFCSTCHKVHVPYELNHYRAFLRGQNHYDSFVLSGVSGYGARSSYFPMRASENCSTCHMPLLESNDFGAKLFAGSGSTAIHDHLFPGANTALPFLNGSAETVRRQQEFLRSSVRVDLVALHEGDRLGGPVTFPLRGAILVKDPHRDAHPEAMSGMQESAKIPALRAGERYVLDVVIRNLRVGHAFTQGTVDSNQVWLDVTVKSGQRIIGRSGGLDDELRVNPESYFVNAYVLDGNGERIARRNPQDIVTVLYDHQIGPGSAAVAHYLLEVPDDADDLISVEVRLQYRKFDSTFMQFVADSHRDGDPPIAGHVSDQVYRNELPITTLASDQVVFAVEGVDKTPPPQEYPIKVDHVYQRWQDYGIALMQEGASLIPSEETGVALRLAEDVLTESATRFAYADTHVHLARLLLLQGRIDEAHERLQHAERIAKPLFFTEPVHAPWAILWMRGLILRQQGDLAGAITAFRSIREFDDELVRQHGYDFRRDYIVINELARTTFEYARQLDATHDTGERDERIRESIALFERTLELDSENMTAHHNLALLYAMQGDEDDAARHRELHLRYRPDDEIRPVLRQRARLRDAAANHAAERIVIYSLDGPWSEEPSAQRADLSQRGDP